MTQVAIVRAIGDGGYQEPRTGTYISSKRDTIVAFTDWVQNLVNHDKVKVVEGPFEGSEYTQYVNHVAQNQGDEAKALEEYRKTLPNGKAAAKTEPVKVVENTSDLVEEKPAKAPAKKAD